MAGPYSRRKAGAPQRIREVSQIILHLPREIAVETVLIAGNNVVALEGVSPGLDPSQLPGVLSKLRETFERARVRPFVNAFGASSYFWQAWKESLPLCAISSGKMTHSVLYLDEPNWDELRDPHSQHVCVVPQAQSLFSYRIEDTVRQSLQQTEN